MCRVLLVFVDGLGLGSSDPGVNPVHSGACPHLRRLLAEDAVPIDAALGVPGLPQSATGQTALLTGVNAPAAMGRHVEGFPGPELRDIIQNGNIFSLASRRGLTSTFANAYFVGHVDEVLGARLKSVTTVAALSAFGTVRGRRELEENGAVYQDLTRESLRERGYREPIVTPCEAADHLVRVALDHDVTLFEYFQTDRAGHRGSMASATQVLSTFDPFLGALCAWAAREEATLVLTSDHGNIEDARVRTHTANAVPFAVVGAGAADLRRRVRSLVDVTPALLDWAAGCGPSDETRS